MTLAPFRVGVTRDLRGPDGRFLLASANLDALDAAKNLDWDFLRSESIEGDPEALTGFDALLHFGPVVPASAVEAAANRLALIARHGVGLDMIDLEACTDAGIAVTITPDGIRRPLASAAVGLILALSHRLFERDRAVREGRWHDGRFGQIGLGLSGKTLGIVGFGTIGREIRRLIEPWEMDVLVATRRGLTTGDLGVHRVVRADLEHLLAASDVVVLACPLTPATHHMIDASRLTLMKPTAFLVNVARGGLIDSLALGRALAAHQIAGAGLDVFETEPLAAGDPLLDSPNLVVAPHAAGYTDELFQACIASACASILGARAGRVPPQLANPAVAGNQAFVEKLARLAANAPSGAIT